MGKLNESDPISFVVDSNDGQYEYAQTPSSGLAPDEPSISLGLNYLLRHREGYVIVSAYSPRQRTSHVHLQNWPHQT